MVNMHGGMHGSQDPMTGAVQPGWIACGFEVTTEPRPERTWQALQVG